MFLNYKIHKRYKFFLTMHRTSLYVYNNEPKNELFHYCESHEIDATYELFHYCENHEINATDDLFWTMLSLLCKKVQYCEEKIKFL